MKFEPANASLASAPNTSPATPNASVPNNAQGVEANVSQPAAAVTPADRPECNISICEQYYQSFRASDCTYQPYSGPRRYCAQ
jgi:penicillin-binding protein 1A